MSGRRAARGTNASAVGVLVLGAWCAGGCSFVTTNRLGGAYQPDATPRCSASMMPPMGDLLLGSAAAINTVPHVNQQRARPAERRDWGGAATNASLAVALIASAIYGWHQLERCEDARDAHDQWLDEHGYRPGRVAMVMGGDDAR